MNQSVRQFLDIEAREEENDDILNSEGEEDLNGILHCLSSPCILTEGLQTSFWMTDLSLTLIPQVIPHSFRCPIAVKRFWIN